MNFITSVASMGRSQGGSITFVAPTGGNGRNTTEHADHSGYAAHYSGITSRSYNLIS